MKLSLFVPWIRPGGGLSAVQQLLGALGGVDDLAATVVLDAPDARAGVAPLIDRYDNLELASYRPALSTGGRYLRSKLEADRFTRGADRVFTINYWLPVRADLTVYHLNLLNFRPAPTDSLFGRIRRLDAGISCGRAERNLFESGFLQESAERMHGRVRGAARLYLGIRSTFIDRIGRSGDRVPGRIAIVSSPLDYKRNDLAVEVLARLRDRRPDHPWHLRAIGGHPDRSDWPELGWLAARFGLEDRVQVLGRLPADALADELTTAGALIAPSEIESFYMVAVEAMACGCSVVVQDVSSAPESVGDAGTVCPRGDVEAMADAVERAEFDPVARDATRERGWAWARRFGPDHFRAALLRVIGA